MFSAFKIIRPLNTVFTFSIVSGFCFLINPHLHFYVIIITGLCAGLSAAAGNIINDIVDVKIDAINKPNRVLPSGKMSIRGAFTLYYLLVSTSIFLSLQISIISFCIVLTANLMLMLYSLRFKGIPGIKNITIAFLAAMIFIYAGTVAGNLKLSIFPAIFAFLSTLLREIIKDIEDITGDADAGLLTFPIRFGEFFTLIVIRTTSALLIVSCCLAYYTDSLSIYFFLMVMLFVSPLIVSLNKKVLQNESDFKTKGISKLAKLIMVLGFVSILLGLC